MGDSDTFERLMVSTDQKCHLESKAENYGAIAAHHRDSPQQDTGFSFVGCRIRGTGSVYLGRAWGDYSRVIYSNCYMDDIINPQGWSEWNHPERKKYTTNCSKLDIIIL